jgi:hypothetical protein
MQPRSIVIAGILIVTLLIVAATVCDINLNWSILYIPVGALLYIAVSLMNNSGKPIAPRNTITGGRNDTKKWQFEEKRAPTSMRPRLPFKRAVSLVSPDFRISQVKHPKGFEMTLVDESQLIGGSKQRALIGFIADIKQEELVYAGPSAGYAQIAIAYCCLLTGKVARIYIDATESQAHPLTRIAREFGATIMYFDGSEASADSKPTSRLRVIQKRAEAYADRIRNSYLLPFGMDSPVVRELYAQAFAPLKEYAPKRLWVVAGSGMIFSTLAKIWPETELMIVQVGKTVWPDQLTGIKHQLFVSPYAFSERISLVPPYNTLMNYDAKVWPYVLDLAEPGDFIWNTAGEPMDINVVRATVGKTNLMLDAARKEESALMTSAQQMTMPMFHDAMPPASVMFAKLREIAISHKPGEIVSRNFTKDYTCVDGISNHFTEDVRMDCIVNRSDKISPKEYWRKYRAVIVREAYWLAGTKPSALDWRDAMNVVKCYECGTFNPVILINAIKKYFAFPSDIMILDPSAGWGDRLIAALACGVAMYVGFDPNKYLHPCYAKIKAELAPESKTLFIEQKYSNAGIPKDLVGQFDLAFTSPPFFDEEIYVGTEHDVEKSYSEWLNAIYEPYLLDMARAIKPEGIVAVYIDNVPRIANMANDTTRILRSASLSLVETLLFRNDTTGINGIVHAGHPRSLWVFKHSTHVPKILVSGGTESSPYPEIQKYNTTMDDEIERLHAVNELVDYVTTFLTRASNKSLTGKKAEYEANNIVERYLLASANHAAVVRSDDPVLVVTPRLLEIFKADVHYKFAMLDDAALTRLSSGVEKIVNAFVNRTGNFEYNSRMRRKISYHGDTATFILGKYQRDIARTRMHLLINIAGEEAVIKMLTRYATIISGSQHWEAPLQYFKVLYALGVRFEGFSSPVNSQFIRPEFPDTHICTLFPDTDAPFGSIGGFFQVDFLSYWRPDFVPMIVVGPPYYDELILNIARRVIDHCDRAASSGKKIRFIITHSNSWDFSQGFKLLNESIYKRMDHIYPAGDHYYNNDRGEAVIARFSTRMFMLDAGLPAVDDEYKTTLLTMFPKPITY